MKDGLIQEVGMSRRVENLSASKNAAVFDATGMVVMPAFIDPSVSLVFAHSGVESNAERLLTGAGQTPASQREDILEGVRALKLVSKNRLILRAAELAASLARHGTGTIGAVSGYGLDETGEVKSLRAAQETDGNPLSVFPIFLGANTPPPEVSAAQFTRNALEPLLEIVSRRKLSRIAAVRCGPHAFDPESARAFLLAARALGLSLSLYSHQFAPDEGISLALEFQALSATHLEHIAGPAIDLLARSRTLAVLTPAATFHMGLPRFAPARKLIDSGAAVALSTAFNPDSCPTHSVPFNIMLACRYLAMSPAEAIAASTINAAHALGISRRAGTLECGKQADLLVLDVRDYRDIPLTPGLNLVHTLFKSGKIVYGPQSCESSASLTSPPAPASPR
jgi:imidazolonepropionase